MPTRRSFVKTAGAATLLGGCELAGLGLRPVSAAEAKLDASMVRFHDNVEPLVRFIEDTPRDSLIEEVAQRVRDGLNYRKLLARLGAL